ncbi:MAG: tRNA pseudouridine(38-40) synthase TruA [Gammaproteobacteria bacterium]|nr:tRNA pseudouridine(38-40) synthase TruA [Gammaproteobacteria bacterium]
MTQRIALGIEYDGSRYCGWQYQDHSPSVQEKVEQALAFVANHEVRVSCAGRTDTGVHALAQVVHFDTDAVRSDHAWVLGGNANLPEDITVLWAKQMPANFHARFSAVRRLYRYVIFNRPMRPAILAKRVSWEYRPLQIERMREATQYLIGEHDFSSYRALACQAKSPVRTLHRLDISRHCDMVILELEANGFLHHMVRNIAGVLMKIGAGEADPAWAREVLEQRDRTQGGVTASPHGLYFVTAYYPDQYSIPALLPPAGVW